jgi:uncharacterized membrane protein YoaK (UPF0700 family)
MNAFDQGRLVGTLLFFVVLILVGVWAGRALAKRRQKPGFVLWPIALALALALLGLFGQIHKRNAQLASSIQTGEFAVAQQS